MKGTIVKSTGSWYDVRIPGGTILSCRLKGRFKLEGKKITNPIAVGDWVELSEEVKGDNTWIIDEIHPRNNYIVRKAIKKTDHAHLLAANIDQVVLMATKMAPRTSLGFIDRVLVTAETYRIPTIIIWNKSDLMEQADNDEIEYISSIYEEIGYANRLICALDKSSVDRILPDLKDKTSLVLGHSGVGKSTMLNELIPGLNQKTSAISNFANKGVHTTTFAEMFSIDESSFIIDTPGIKELGLSEIYDEELSHYFPEMRVRFGQCRFHNCTHIHEPDCAILKAVEDGEIAESRFLSYLSMFQEEDTHR